MSAALLRREQRPFALTCFLRTALCFLAHSTRVVQKYGRRSNVTHDVTMIVTVLLLPVVTALCPDTATCINRVKEIVAAPRKFWFGEQRRSLCQGRNADSVDCFGPEHLSAYHSVGSRLFRVRTYHAAYLRNLRIFPRVTFRAHSGEYRACDHEYRAGNGSAQVIEADPDMTPVAPYFIRSKPEITWQGLRYDEEFTLAIIDVGFGSLNYLVTGFPQKPMMLHDYEPSENFRPEPNPMVVVVFRKSKHSLGFGNPKNFDISKFMLENDIADDLIGLSLVIVGSDPFAIERQRLRGTVDNCHSLLRNKLRRHPPSSLLSQLPLDELNSWLTVSVGYPKMDVNVCCHRIQQRAVTKFFDPLGALTVSALSMLTPPTVTSARITVQSSSYVNYHRQARTHIALMDDLYSLVALDATTSTLHWMIVDIPAQELASAPNGITKASYLPFAPAKPASCSPFALFLFSQPSSLDMSPIFCDGQCEQRKKFR
ncbi:hypothetical protein NECAME_03873 [Necator americanus]|uniref:Uncharacterized protein n=1 Tax=Necator americanus TaxID=51031 RepID=W2SZB6_NECAM|nr:hypothetical protein NECAME_03873 [Necator americanus]ETN74958.1 hypothetical protein NECAME_03873 [Necator americanus]